MQIGGVQPLGRSHGHARIGQGRQQRADDVPAGHTLRIQHHHDLARGPAQASLQRVAGTEGDRRAHDLVGRPLHGGLRPGHHDHLAALRQGAAQCREGRIRTGAIAREDDDRGDHRSCLLQPRRHRLDRAVARLAVGDLVRGPGWLQVVASAEVDDLPAGGLDASLELVGGAVVALDSRSGALVGERDDVVGN